jgi:hypothetical protein
MTPVSRLVPPLLAALALAACGGPVIPGPATVGTAPVRPVPPRVVAPGMTQVIGAEERALLALLGRPDAELTEGAGRKLQFASPICVLDAYLYAPRDGAAPVVTHVDTRQRTGAPIDQASCVAALTRRSGGK